MSEAITPEDRIKLLQLEISLLRGCISDAHEVAHLESSVKVMNYLSRSMHMIDERILKPVRAAEAQA